MENIILVLVHKIHEITESYSLKQKEREKIIL